jgi:hypothetical protein
MFLPSIPNTERNPAQAKPRDMYAISTKPASKACFTASKSAEDTSDLTPMGPASMTA